MVHMADGCSPATRTLPSLTLTSPQNQVALSSDVNPSLCLGKEVQWSLTVFVTTAAVSAGNGATVRTALNQAGGSAGQEALGGSAVGLGM